MDWETIDRQAHDTSFSGVVRIDDAESGVRAEAYGLADRRLGVANTVETRFAVASGSKLLTALVVVALIERGMLSFETAARSVLGGDLPSIDPAVTLEHLLAHRSGIGDYLDEDLDPGVDDYLMPVPVHHLADTEDYLAVLDGHPMKFSPGERFSYCNGGYVVLALVAERAASTPFHDLVDRLVCGPAAMTATSFERSDELPGTAAIGYLDGDATRTNVFHLPVRGSGDGGAYTTVADVHALWHAFLSGHVVSPASVAEMLRPRSEVPSLSMRYGLGVWLHATTNALILEGSDAGVSFRSVHDPDRQITATVVSNTSSGAWPIARSLGALVEP
ncbi:MAG TPA: serine hydrolase domain-containing protein [Acidimicrobiia bacterium]|nr:serine hydrolase domain-containing protein [Acidimicrobiia bacterium]